MIIYSYLQLVNCSLYFQANPYVIVATDKPGNKLEGFCIDIVNVLSKYLNFRLVDLISAGLVAEVL